MPQIVTCPDCTKTLQVPDNLIGKTVQCPECRNTFTATLETEGDAEDKTSAASKPPDQEKKPRSKVRDRDDDDDDRDDRDDDVDVGRRSRRRSDEKPGKVQGIGIMMLIGGIYALLHGLGMGGFSWGICCLWPGTYYCFVVGIMAIIRASALLGSNAQQQTVPSGIAIMMIIDIVNGDVLNCVLGIICLIFCGDEEVTGYLAR
jgi:hypothetical protein